MGLWNSFKGQLGRDTGRVVSNILYKDKHASVYRRVGDSMKNQNKKSSEVDDDIEEQKILTADEIRLSKEIDEKIEDVINIDIPDNQKELLILLGKISLLMRGNSFGDSDDSEITNRYSEVILQKYEQIFRYYCSLYPTDPNIDYHKKELNKFKINKIVKSNYGIIIGIVALAIVFLICSIGMALES